MAEGPSKTEQSSEPLPPSGKPCNYRRWQTHVWHPWQGPPAPPWIPQFPEWPEILGWLASPGRRAIFSNGSSTFSRWTSAELESFLIESSSSSCSWSCLRDKEGCFVPGHILAACVLLVILGGIPDLLLLSGIEKVREINLLICWYLGFHSSVKTCRAIANEQTK